VKANPTRGRAAVPNPGAEVVVTFLEGGESRGCVGVLNPRLPTFTLTRDGGPQRLSFDAVKSIAFLCASADRSRRSALPGNARLVKVRFRDGSTLEGVAENFGGPRAGVYLVPTGLDSVERVYIPVSAITDVVSVRRLADLLGEQRMVTMAMVAAAVQPEREPPPAPVLPPEPEQDAIHTAAPLAPMAPETAPLSPESPPSPGARPRRAAERQRQESLIGEILVEQGFITPEELGGALLASKRQREKKLGEVMIEMGYTSPKIIAIALSIQYNLPFASLLGYAIDYSLCDLLRREEAAQWQLLPLSLEEGMLTVAIADPVDDDFRETLEGRCGASIREVVATPQDIARMIAVLYGSTSQAAAESR
jgi:hypothetical protein